MKNVYDYEKCRMDYVILPENIFEKSAYFFRDISLSDICKRTHLLQKSCELICYKYFISTSDRRLHLYRNELQLLSLLLLFASSIILL